MVAAANSRREITRIPTPEWQRRRDAHEQRLRSWLDPHQERAARGEKHPVWDFLFSYYAFRPAWLRQWHPGPDVLLEGEEARAFLRWPEYEETMGGVLLDPTHLPEKRRVFVSWLHGLLAAMVARPAYFGCHGLHEWAMVYRQSPDEIRHNAWPLRFDADGIAAVVERGALACTHFDAFRFFTGSAAPLNRHKPTRETAPALEQRGCLHANMDLYKWAFKLAPFTPSELIADCFELACDIREVDMRASPYDLRELGFQPIPIETAAGRNEFEQHQRRFAARAEPLRARLMDLCVILLDSGSPRTAESTGRTQIRIS
ncbi:MAG: 3-methyladenine DNA glycosylase [Opitutaceae bacterium]|nr:3-methyladenine DNA glycosylase [Opitutaceae bacterium]